jgi:hypothetical protein
MSTPSGTPINCANTYICPGAGEGYGVQMNITSGDIDTLVIPTTGLTVAASASEDAKTVNAQLSASIPPGTPSSSLPDFVSDNALTWWWNNVVKNYAGIVGTNPMNCIQPGRNGFAVGLAQTIVTAFGISPTRICNATLIPTKAANNIDIATVKFTFYVTNLRPSSPLNNDHLPAACAGEWIVTWLNKATNPTQPTQAVIPPTPTVPENLQSKECPARVEGAPSPTLYFTNVDKDTPEFIEKLRQSFSTKFSKKSFLSVLFKENNVELLTNVQGTSLRLAGSSSSIYAPPITLLDYIVRYSYPLSFVGAILFTIVQIMDVNLNTLVANKNMSMAINISFIVWSVVSMLVFYNIPLTWIPIVGDLLSIRVPLLLPLNTQTVVTQA